MANEAGTADKNMLGGLTDKWNSFFDQVQKDPNLQASLIQFGSSMLNSDQRQPFMGAVSNSFQDATNVLESRRSSQSAAKAAEEKRKRDLATQAITDDESRSKAEKNRRVPAPAQSQTSDLERAAAAMAATDPAYSGAGGKDRALADLYKAKGGKDITFDKFVMERLNAALSESERDLTNITAEWDAIQKAKQIRSPEGQAAAKAGAQRLTDIGDRAKASMVPMRPANTPPKMTEADVRKFKPNASPEMVRAILSSPKASEELRAILSKAPIVSP